MLGLVEVSMLRQEFPVLYNKTLLSQSGMLMIIQHLFLERCPSGQCKQLHKP